MKQCVFPPGRSTYDLVITLSAGQVIEKVLINSRIFKLNTHL